MLIPYNLVIDDEDVWSFPISFLTIEKTLADFVLVLRDHENKENDSYDKKIKITIFSIMFPTYRVEFVMQNLRKDDELTT